MHSGPKGSMTILLASSSSRMDRSESTTGQHDSVMPPRGRSSAAEHQLPKLRTRVRFPSPAQIEVLVRHIIRRVMMSWRRQPWRIHGLSSCHLVFTRRPVRLERAHVRQTIRMVGSFSCPRWLSGVRHHVIEPNPPWPRPSPASSNRRPRTGLRRAGNPGRAAGNGCGGARISCR
jgi:hypothetical protein